MRIHEQQPTGSVASAPALDMADARAADVGSRLFGRDAKTLVRFIEVYCSAKHATSDRRPVTLKRIDLEALAGHSVALCPCCAKLCMHAVTKREACPMDPKPSCKQCPEHCYHPDYRRQIKEVMRFSGMRLVLRGRLDYLAHLLF